MIVNIIVFALYKKDWGDWMKTSTGTMTNMTKHITVELWDSSSSLPQLSIYLFIYLAIYLSVCLSADWDDGIWQLAQSPLLKRLL